MRLYFAGPLFSEAERAFNLNLTRRLEALGFTVFLPQRDGVERDKPPYDAMPAEQKRRLLFETDRDEILKADVFLYVLDGRVPTKGRRSSWASPTRTSTSPAPARCSSGCTPTCAHRS